MTSRNHLAWLAPLMLLLAGAVQAQGVDNWRGAGDLVWRNGSGDLCWRSGAWTPATAVQGCDGAIVAVAPAAAPRPLSRIVLLPDAEGKVGRIELLTGGRAQPLDQAYQQATTQDGQARLEVLSKAAVEGRFGTLYQGLPRAASRYLLYFESGGARLTGESHALLPQIRAQLQNYPGVEVVITGHTDRAGNEADNEALSFRRANAVREILLAAGFPPERMDTVGRGERELLVPTADGVAEARNRRVEVKLR
jgi:OOP family OmpA-OmpF porin